MSRGTRRRSAVWGVAAVLAVLAIAAWMWDRSAAPGRSEGTRQAPSPGVSERTADEGPAVQRQVAEPAAAVAPPVRAQDVGSRLLVRVVDRGDRPVDHAPVNLLSSDPRVPQSGVTRENGEFGVDVERGAFVRVRVGQEEQDAEMSGGTVTRTFVVERFRSIAVRAVDGQGTPVADAEVMVSNTADPDSRAAAGVTDADGHCDLPVYDTRDFVSLVKRGWVPSDQLPVTGALPDPARPGFSVLDVVLERATDDHDLSGTVCDADGRALAGVSIRWCPQQPRPRYRGFLTRRMMPPETTTDAGGRFRVPAWGDSGTLVATKDGYAEVRTTLKVPHDLAAPFAIVLHPECVLSGRVVDEHGSPVPGAEIRSSSADCGVRSVLSSADGAFALRALQPGPPRETDRLPAERLGLHVVACHPGRGLQQAFVPCVGGQPPVWNPVLAGPLIVGAVRDGGKPIGGAEIVVTGSVPDRAVGGWLPVTYHVRSEPDTGHFAIVRPVGPSWELDLIDPRDRSAAPLCRLKPAEIGPFCELDVSLLRRGFGQVTAQVMDSEGSPIDVYWLRLRRDQGRWSSVLCTDPSGTIRARVAPGDYAVAVTPRGASLLQPVGRVRVAAGQVADLGRIVAQRPGGIRGTIDVRGQSDHPIDGIGIMACPEDFGIPFACRRLGREWSLDGLAAGTWVLRPSHGSTMDFDDVPVTVRPDVTETVPLTCWPCWRGRLVIHCGIPDVGPLTLVFENCKGQRESRPLDRAHAHRWGGLWIWTENVHMRPGKGEVTVRSGAGRTWTEPADASGTGILQITLR